MWGGIFVCLLVFWGTLSFGADVCRGLPTAPRAGPFPTLPYDPPYKPRPESFRLRVKSGGPEFRITVSSLPVDWQSFPSPEYVHAGDIEIADCQGGARLHVLPIMAAQPIDFAGTFFAKDVNFDGYLDISVFAETGGPLWVGSEWWWIYDPRSGRFVQNELTQELHDLGIPNLGRNFEDAKHEITYPRFFPLTGACAEGTERWGETSRYRIENNRMILVHDEKLDWGVSNCTLTVSDLVGGEMVVTGVRSKPAKASH